MEQYDPGHRAADITPVFAELKTFLKDFVPEALAVQDERLAKSPLKPLSGNYPTERQRELGLAMMAAVGFDLTHGSLSVSHHPFCGGVPSDVRITTRYRSSDFLSALMGVLHETGHALYEQNLPKEWSHWPVGKARGMAMHESQSLFVEKQLGRNPAFWQWALPVVERHLGEAWSMADILPHVHRVERGLIRVDADEVTYPLHVILRFELEQELVAGKLEAADIPEAWDAKMRDYLGLSTIRQFCRRPDAGRALAGRGLRLFPVLYARRHDGRAAMGGAEKGQAFGGGRCRQGKIRGGQRLAARKNLVAGFTLFDARTARTRDRRETECRPFHEPSETALRNVTMGTAMT